MLPRRVLPAGRRASADRRAWAVLVLAGLAVAVAAWLIPASQFIVSWQAGTLGRVALVAPPQRLAWASLGAVALTGLVGVWWRRSGRPLGSLARRLAPTLLLWLWVVPYLPRLPTELPLLLLLAGPWRWAVAGLALVGCVAKAIEDRGGGSRRWPGRVFVFVTSLALFIGVGHCRGGLVSRGSDKRSSVNLGGPN